MPAFPARLLCCALLVMAGAPNWVSAADPVPAETKTPATDTTTPAVAEAKSGAEATPAAASADLALPTAPEALLLARLEAKTLAADFIKLGDDAQPILARYRAATKLPAKGAVLFIPAPGHFIGDDAVIAAALAELPGGGWSVLAVQTPLLPMVASMKHYEDRHDQALERAKKALEYLAQQHTPASVVVGRAGSIELAREVATLAGEVTALVALGPWSGQIGASKLPLFDVSSDRDRAALACARERYAEAGRAKTVVYKQVVLSGADQRFSGFESEITRRIRGFAEHLPAPGKVTSAPGS